jgi:Zn-dependent protease
VSATESKTDDAPLTCSVCGRSSIWRDAFVEIRAGTAKILCCPRCERVHREKEQRSGLIWIAIMVVLAVIYVTQGRGHGLDLIVIAALFFSLAQFPLTVLHEAGHAFASRLLGVPAYAIVIGHEPWVFDRRVFGLRLRIGWLPSGGLTYHAPSDGNNAWIKDLVITAAGPLTNLAIAVAGFAATASMTGRFEHSLWRFAAFMVGAASAMQFAWNIWPHSVNAHGTKVPNDGARMLGLLRGKRDTHEDATGADHYFRAFFAFSDGEFEIAAREADIARRRFKEPDAITTVSVLAAAAMSESDDARGAVSLLRPLHEGHVGHTGLRSGVLDNLGWAYLLLDEPETIERARLLIEAACDIAPWEDSYVISLACAYAASSVAGDDLVGEARKFLTTVNPKRMTRQNGAYAQLAQGLCALAEGDLPAARTHYDNAKSRGATAAPLRLLERRFASL